MIPSRKRFKPLPVNAHTHQSIIVSQLLSGTNPAVDNTETENNEDHAAESPFQGTDSNDNIQIISEEKTSNGKSKRDDGELLITDEQLN